MHDVDLNVFACMQQGPAQVYLMFSVYAQSRACCHSSVRPSQGVRIAQLNANLPEFTTGS